MLSLLVHDWTPILFASAQEVLETMFFCSVYGTSQVSLSEDLLCSKLRFEGDPSGSITIGLSTEAVRNISANFLGIDENELSRDQLEQVVGELANMICGSVLSRTAEGRKFRLTHPEMVPYKDLTAHPDSVAVNLEIEQGVLTSQIDFDVI